MRRFCANTASPATFLSGAGEGYLLPLEVSQIIRESVYIDFLKLFMMKKGKSFHKQRMMTMRQS